MRSNCVQNDKNVIITNIWIVLLCMTCNGQAWLRHTRWLICNLKCSHEMMDIYCSCKLYIISHSTLCGLLAQICVTELGHKAIGRTNGDCWTFRKKSLSNLIKTQTFLFKKMRLNWICSPQYVHNIITYNFLSGRHLVPTTDRIEQIQYDRRRLDFDTTLHRRRSDGLCCLRFGNTVTTDLNYGPPIMTVSSHYQTWNEDVYVSTYFEGLPRKCSFLCCSGTHPLYL